MRLKTKYFFGIIIALITTTEICANWLKKDIGTTRILNSVFFVNDNIGWIVGRNKTLLKTIDGGNNWLPQDTSVFEESPVIADLADVFFIDENVGWIVSNHIYKTINGGGTWNKVYHDSSYKPSGMDFVQFVTPNIGWAIGGYAGSKILKTVDGGQNWSFQNNPKPLNFIDAFFVDSLNGWIVDTDKNHNNVILKTTDGGNNWQINRESDDYFLCSIHFPDISNGWAVGYYSEEFGDSIRSVILNTNDGGGTWNEQNVMINTCLLSVIFLNPLVGWAVGGHYEFGNGKGIILHTTDGGDTWTQQESNPTNSLYSVHIHDNRFGWIVGGGGVYLHTSNGGASTINFPNLPKASIGDDKYPFRYFSFDSNNEVELFSLRGIMVRKIKSKYEDLKGTSKGLYILKYKQKNKTYTQRLFIIP